MDPEIIEAWAKEVLTVMVAAMSMPIAIILWIIAIGMLGLVVTFAIDFVRMLFFPVPDVFSLPAIDTDE